MADPHPARLSDGIYGAELERRIDAAAAAIGGRLAAVPALVGPRLALVLGSGLAGIAELLDDEPRLRIAYTDIPHIPAAHVEGHAGELLVGLSAGTPVIVLSGRSHAYEGYSQREITILLRACVQLGVETVVLTNAAGGVNPEYEPGEVMLIADAINLSGDSPLIGPNLDRFGPRFPALTDAFDAGLRDAARAAARRVGIGLHEGVYVMLTGPSYETRAEMRMLRTLGGDAVGMSTVPELIVARHAGARVLGFSLVTNKATGEGDDETSHAEVVEIGRTAASRLVSLLRELLPALVPAAV